MNNVMDKYKTVSNEEISKERENVLKMENSGIVKSTVYYQN